ncbi:lanthionine synthetase C family protein [Nonomuraea fuscirosea]|jgi:lantibiotic biosynthesis protein|uniref:lanthionine synthetase C family protein n=1 Tax=Nonomuraea fuscirosea TaxID=1291556 RepID=UPI0034107BB6
MITTTSGPIAQSLAAGAAGTALLHIERAHIGSQPWRTAHEWIKAATSQEISVGEHAGLYFGAPAISFILHATPTGRYGKAIATIDAHVTRLAERRLAHMTARVERGEAVAFADYDLFRGLTGIAALLVRHVPDADILEPILSHLIRLTCPTSGGLPGWWVDHDPASTVPTPGGHANLGVAHGAGGILAVFAIALRDGVAVDGQADAIQRICACLDQWQQDGEAGPWWPQWITRADLKSGRTWQRGPGRPSWCYGTVGIARAQQLAAIALGDTIRQRLAEHALATCLADPAQLACLTEPGLCHGIAGVYQTAWRAARDALTHDIAARLPTLTAMLHQTDPHADDSLLTGSAGLALARHTAAHNAPPRSGWDTCLLIT